MTEDQIRARDAEAVLANPVFKGAFKKMAEVLDNNIASVNPDNKDQCARVVLAKQILKGLEREIYRYVEEGEIQNLIELDRERKKSLKQRVFSR